MKIFMSIALGAASIVSTAALAPTSIMAQAAAEPAQPAAVKATAVSLETKIDSKTAKAGDVISVKLLQDTAVGATKYPSGSHLLGKITSAESNTLAILFDSIQVKKADPVPVHAGLAAVAGPYDAYVPSGGGGDPMSGSTGAAAGPGPLDMTATGSSIKGVTLTLSKTADSSGTLSGAKDFKLDKGTRMWVGLF